MIRDGDTGRISLARLEATFVILQYCSEFEELENFETLAQDD
jgi:hypothetical protein